MHLVMSLPSNAVVGGRLRGRSKGRIMKVVVTEVRFEAGVYR